MRTYYSNTTTNRPGGGFREIFRGRSALSRLILINVVVFAVVALMRLGKFLWMVPGETVVEEPLSKIAQWLAVPASLDALWQQPWSLLTYQFMHEGIMHIFFNMLVLYFGGRIFTEFLGGKRLTATYLLGGLMGAVFYVAAYNIFPVFSSVVGQSMAIGASASALAVLVAAATFAPNHSVTVFFTGRVKLKYIALILVAVDLLSIERSNPGGHISHLGGAFWGFLYILILKRNLNPFPWLAGRWNALRKALKPKPKLRVSHHGKRPLTDDEYNNRKVEHQKKIDAILDKISRSGYESLNRDEKELLFKSSKNEF